MIIYLGQLRTKLGYFPIWVDIELKFIYYMYIIIITPFNIYCIMFDELNKNKYYMNNDGRNDILNISAVFTLRLPYV